MNGIVPFDTRCQGELPLHVLFVGTKDESTGKYAQIQKDIYSEISPVPVVIKEDKYKAGQIIGIFVRYEWNRVPEGARDITVKVYSKMKDLKLVDEHGRTNMQHMDSQYSFKIEQDDGNGYQPKSLIDLVKNTKSIPFFFEELKENLWILFMWFTEY